MMLLIMGITCCKIQPTKCWAPEINAAFAGKLDGCNSDGTVSAQPLHLACVRRVRERVQTSFMVSLFSIEAERGLKKSRAREGKWGRKVAPPITLAVPP